MRLNVSVADRHFRIGIHNGNCDIGWLHSEILKRFAAVTNGQRIVILELRTYDNQTLDSSDRIFDVLKDNDNIIAVLRQSDGMLEKGELFQEKYVIVKKLAEGSFGEVFIAKDLNLDREVAVKVLKRNKSSEVTIRRFIREAKLTAKLSNHPNIVSIYDFGRTESGMFYLVMVLLEGQCLDEWLERRVQVKKPLTEVECLQMFIQIADGLDAAHSHNPPIIHRDLVVLFF